MWNLWQQKYFQRFINKQEASGLLGGLGKTPLSQVLMVGLILFEMYTINEIINMIVLGGDKFMP